jgi:hypothetical protein
MGYHHQHLPSVEQLKSQLENVGAETFVKRYLKYECIIGESDRIEFVKKIIKEFNEKRAADTTH